MRKYNKVTHREAISGKILPSIGGSRLSELTLTWMDVPDNLLRNLLLRCKLTLARVTISLMWLYYTDSGWNGVFQAIHETPNIGALHLSTLSTKIPFQPDQQRYPWLDFSPLLQHQMANPTDMTDSKLSVNLLGKSAVNAGMRLLADAELQFNRAD